MAEPHRQIHVSNLLKPGEVAFGDGIVKRSSPQAGVRESLEPRDSISKKLAIPSESKAY